METCDIGAAHVACGDALTACASWPPPTCIVVDGPYGVAGYPGDPPSAEGLADWYRPHVSAWSERSLPATTLWFWGTELSWATVHPVLLAAGWEYRTFYVWDKGIAHVAGNVNGNTIRRFPVVTECCVQYVRAVRLPGPDGQPLPLQQWLRAEWRRAGLPLSEANVAAGVKNAATRKYLTADHLWYFPPPEIMQQMAAYANAHGRPSETPYFSLDNSSPLTADAWSQMRAKWHHVHGISNVWSVPALRGSERLKDDSGRVIHTNQKPLVLMERIVAASTDAGDVVWEPFGGLCTASLAAMRLGRPSYAAEMRGAVFAAACQRLNSERTSDASAA